MKRQQFHGTTEEFCLEVLKRARQGQTSVHFLLNPSDPTTEVEIDTSRTSEEYVLDICVRFSLHQLLWGHPEQDSSFAEEDVALCERLLLDGRFVLAVAPHGMFSLLEGDSAHKIISADVAVLQLRWRELPKRYDLMLAALRKNPALIPRVLRVTSEMEKAWLRKIALAPFPGLTSPQNTEVSYMSISWVRATLYDECPHALNYLTSVLLSPLSPPDENSQQMSEVGEKFFRSHRQLVTTNVLNLLQGIQAVNTKEGLEDVSYFLHQWKAAAFTRVDVGHKVMAALMLTDAPPDVPSPWKAFSVIVQPGLLEPLRRIFALPVDGRVQVVNALDDKGTLIALSEEQAQLLDNLVRSVCLVASEQGSYKVCKKERNGGRQAREQGPPSGEFYRIAPAIQIDLREAVREAWEGKKRRGGGPPKVQFVVRGHPREQACGPHHALRKHIWIHPFWKGPKEARALLRLYELGKEEE